MKRGRPLIIPTNNGPYYVKGKFKIVTDGGREIAVDDGNEAWLCRCGQSAAEPLCDGSHKRLSSRAIWTRGRDYRGEGYHVQQMRTPGM